MDVFTGEFSNIPSEEASLQRLASVDEDETITVTPWEAEFIESILYKRDKTLSLTWKQESAVQRILEKYKG